MNLCVVCLTYYKPRYIQILTVFGQTDLRFKGNCKLYQRFFYAQVPTVCISKNCQNNAQGHTKMCVLSYVTHKTNFQVIQ